VSIILNTAFAEFAGLVFPNVGDPVVAARFLAVVIGKRDTGVSYSTNFLPLLLDYLSEVRLLRSVIIVLFSWNHENTRSR
jgi:hypothetical protein